MFGAAAMSLSSVCVVSNALRLKFFRPLHAEINPQTPAVSMAEATDTRKDESTMEKTIVIEGMMCPHCSGHVRDALTQAVTDAGYKVVGIE